MPDVLPLTGIAMNRCLHLTLIMLAMLSSPALSQTFSDDDTYVAFYNKHFNPKFESSSEAAIAIWWIIECFGKPDTTREQLRDYLTRYTTLFPNSKQVELAKSHLKVVERMLGEKRPPDETKIDQLIYDLRDLNMLQFKQPNRGLRIIGQGSLQFRNLPRNSKFQPDAAEQLFEMGYNVIPSLIDHVDDDTLTRSVDFWRDFTFSHRVLTVGDCCRQIIDTILPTGEQFDFSSDPKKAKEAMKNWYQQQITQKKAEPSIGPKGSIIRP
jgi:hypothetical protein